MARKYKIEFSKIIFIFVAIVDIVVTIEAICCIHKTGDTSIFAYLIPAKAAELATGTGFYYNKAKKENSKKIANQLINDFADKYGIDSVMQMLGNLRDY